MNRALAWLAVLLWVSCAAARGIESIPGCTFVEADWADGDSFPVRLPDGTELTVRLYGADCLEMHVRDDSDARRLRAQRRYFGHPPDDPARAIAVAKAFGAEAAARVRELLGRPFTVHTAFADARGDSRHRRVYAFVEISDGRDLASVLVEEGLARAFGVARATPDGQTAEEYRERLKDLELTAAAGKRGAWAATDWNRLSQERQAQRAEEAEIALATGARRLPSAPIDPNTASRDELMSLPGVGEALATRIIEGREQGPYLNAEDLRRVPGLGPSAIEKLAPHIAISPPTGGD